MTRFRPRILLTVAAAALAAALGGCVAYPGYGYYGYPYGYGYNYAYAAPPVVGFNFTTGGWYDHGGWYHHDR